MAIADNLARAMPIRNQRAATGIKQANDLGIQALAGQANAPGASIPNIKTASQVAGAAQVASTGKQQVAQAQQQAQQSGQIGQLGLQEQQGAVANQLAQRKLVVDKESLTNQAKLASMSEDAKNKIFDSQLAFKRDEAGRVWMNERQLADWARSKAKSTEELKNYEQMATQAYDRKMQVLKMAHAKVLQAIDIEMKKDIQSTNHATRARMAEYKLNLEKEMAEAEARRAENAAIYGAAYGVIGAVFGGVTGGGPGAAAGGKVGYSAGAAQAQ